MQYLDLPVYSGRVERCASCERKFKIGEVITVTEESLVFCYSDGGGGCLIDYMMFKMKPPRVLLGMPQIYQQKLDADPQKPLLTRVLHFFGFGTKA